MNNLSKIRTKNLYKKTKNLISRYQSKGLTFIRYNEKTLICLDKGNICPKDQNKKACKYCYKADIDKMFKSFENGKRTYFEPNILSENEKILLQYFIRDFKKILKQYGKEDFSVRVFSFSDYIEEHKVFWKQVLTIFRENNLKTHAITKQYESIHFFLKHCNTVNISVDTLAEKENIHKAMIWKALSNRIKIRSVELNQCDIDFFQHMKEIDIHTLYHGSIKNRDIDNIKNYSHKEISEKQSEYGNYCCAENGKCINCMLCQ